MLNPNLDPYLMQSMGIGNFQLFNKERRLTIDSGKFTANFNKGGAGGH